MKWHWFIAGLVLASCSTVPTNIAPKPDVTPVSTSNKQIRESSTKIKTSNTQALKLNKDIQGDLSSAADELDKLLK
jgi:uncharacterized protein YceK